MSNRLGINVGKRFTDILLFDDSGGKLHSLKTPTTTSDHWRGVVDGIQKLLQQTGIAAADIENLLLGTSLASDTIMAGRGAKVGLLTTQHFEHVLHLARSQIAIDQPPTPLSGWIALSKPHTLADLEMTRGIAERIDAHGEIIKPLDEEQALVVIQQLLELGVESITIALLHSYANPLHEQRLRVLIEQLDRNIPIYLSSDFLPDCEQEYERTLAIVMNAYVQPTMRRYLEQLEQRLGEIQLTTRVSIARCDNTLMNMPQAVDTPLYSIRADTAGVALGVAKAAAIAGYPNALGLHIGTYSTESMLIQNGEPLTTGQLALADDYLLDLPAIAAQRIEIGAASVAQILINGSLHISNDFIGNDVNRDDSTQATLGDVHQVLRRLSTSQQDRQAAQEALVEIAQTLELDVPQIAQGLLDIANETLFGALRQTASKHHFEVDELALLATGALGSLHGNAIAQIAGCYPVIIPAAAGVAEALGFLLSETQLPKYPKTNSDPQSALIEQQRVYFEGSLLNTNIYDHSLLNAGQRIHGPALIIQTGTTAVIYPAHYAEVDEYLNLLIYPDAEAAHGEQLRWR